MKVTKDKLRRFYLRNGIQRRATGKKFLPSGYNLELLEARRMEFSEDLAEHLVHDRPIVYFDETTLNSWIALKKAWYFKDRKFVVPVSSDRGKNFTVYGAVGNCLLNDYSYFEIHDSTNKEDFMSYIENLATEISPELDSKPWLLLDNHRAHIGRDRL